MRTLTCLFALLLIAGSAFSQAKRISGTVVSKSLGKPLEGVTVQAGSNATTTDSLGAFAIQADPSTQVVFTYTSMKSVTLIASAITTDPIIMEDALQSISEVVVVGYISQRRKDVTGSVAVVDLNPVKNTSSGNTMQALQGRVAGLYVEKDGSPNGSNGRILIRGANTLGNTDPLYIIDGVPTTRPEVFQNMDPANISSVQVLKDASAASIYGS
ncbi:MAG: TonB-dependent receptor plug domain-containing protein, partial [Flavitalea sp.]